MTSPWHVIEFGMIMAGLFGVGIAVRWMINNLGHVCRELDERVRRQRRDIPVGGKP